jgi:hypothetical protein
MHDRARSSVSGNCNGESGNRGGVKVFPLTVILAPLTIVLTPCLPLAAASSALSAQITNLPDPAPAPRDTARMTEPLGGYQVRKGFWMSGGLGYGSVDCGPYGPSLGGPTGNLEAGWNLSRRFALGLGTSAWTHQEGRVRMSIGSVDLRVRYYPGEGTGGLFLIGAWGIGLIRLSDAQADPTHQTQSGRAFRGGLGYDLRVAPGVSLTPFGTGSAVRTEKDGNHMRADVWQVGLGVTLH